MEAGRNLRNAMARTYNNPEQSLGDFEETPIRVESENFSAFAYRALSQLMKRLETDYPDRIFTILDWILLNPIKSGLKLSAYIAYDNKKEIGIAIGDKTPERFDLKLFVIDPKYQNSPVAKQLMDQVLRNNERVTLEAGQFGGRKSLSPERNTKRQQALIAYYQKIGFKPNVPDPETYKADSGEPLPMVWKRELETGEKLGET